MVRTWALPGLALLLQSSTLVNIGAPARPEHLKYQRPIRVLSGGTGMACAVLDATVLGHTASAAHSDLRVFRMFPGGGEMEVPYTLTESGPEPVADTQATVEHAAVSRNQLSFDLRMPARPYTEVRLRLALKNFVGTATAEGRDRQGHHAALGSVAVFDLSGEHLGRWTSLLLGEPSWPGLPVTLALRPRGGWGAGRGGGGAWPGTHWTPSPCCRASPPATRSGPTSASC